MCELLSIPPPGAGGLLSGLRWHLASGTGRSHSDLPGPTAWFSEVTGVHGDSLQRINPYLY